MASATKKPSILFDRSHFLQRRLKRAIERTLRLKILRSLPLGSSVLADIKECLAGYEIRAVLDVGANIGQTAAQFKFWSPDCAVYCVEPVRQNFEELTRNTAGLRGVKCIHLGLGDVAGTTEMVLSGPVSTFRIAGPGEASNAPKEIVQIDTLDHLCAGLGISAISYLKIDTEGHDLKVLQGAEGLLRRQAVDFIEVEAGTNPDNQLHVPLETLKAFLEGRGFLLFGLYEQRHDWPTGRPILRRCNAVFVSRLLADQYRKSAP